MKKFGIVLVLCITGLMAQDYVGTKKCKMCHNKTKSGKQYSVWAETKHAKAFEALKTEEALKYAQERGIKVSPTEAPECVKCHVTGYDKGGYEIKGDDFWSQVTDKGKPTKEVKLMSALQSVGCEACHGPGSKYKKKKTMKGIFDGTLAAADYGLTIPDEKTCVKCHNEESPSYKPFNFDEFVQKIAHNFPEGFRQQ
ncbi:MAG: multiheme c-type cytochrome [Fidelibacterota bacterium]